MESVLVFGALATAGYLMATTETELPEPRERTLAHYYVQGSTYEDISDALKRGIRLIEVNVYSDAQDEPVVSLKPNYDGYSHRSFESVCVDLVNDGFPSNDPLIVSIVLNTEKNFTINRVAYHLNTTVRKHYVTGPVEEKPLDELANKIILVSGYEVKGTDLEPLINLSWNESHLRRLNYQQAAHPREQTELFTYAKDKLVLVAPDQAFNKFKVMSTVHQCGCQWNLCPRAFAQPGFISRE